MCRVGVPLTLFGTVGDRLWLVPNPGSEVAKTAQGLRFLVERGKGKELYFGVVLTPG